LLNGVSAHWFNLLFKKAKTINGTANIHKDKSSIGHL
jgi:hypothetical protein